MESKRLTQIATEVRMKRRRGTFTNVLINDKKERKSQKKKKLKELANSYSKSISMHGIDRIRKGKPVEKIVYGAALSVGFALILIVIYALVVKYQSHAMYNEVTIKQTKRNTFPAVSICINRGSTTSYCGRALNTKLPDDLAYCNWDKKLPITKPVFWHLQDKSYWTSDDFTVATKDFVMQNDFLLNYMHVTNHSQVSCITFNQDGTFYNHQGKIKFSVALAAKHHTAQQVPDIELIIHNPGENALVKDTGTIRLTTAHNYKVMLRKTKLKRLPPPFPSKCTSSNNNNMFSNTYSIVGCQETVKCKKALKTCGDTFDFCKDFLTPDLFIKYQRTKPFTLIQKCLLEKMDSFIATDKECLVPCNEVKYDVLTSAFSKHSTRHAFDLILEYENKYFYTSIEEKEMHSWYQFVGEIGGFIGLMMGMSIITLIEVFSCLILNVAALCYKKRCKFSPTCDF